MSVNDLTEQEMLERVTHILSLSDGEENFTCYDKDQDGWHQTYNSSTGETISIMLDEGFELFHVFYVDRTNAEWYLIEEGESFYPEFDNDLVYEFLENNYL